MNTIATATRLSLLFVIGLCITSSFSQKQLYVNGKIDTNLINTIAIKQNIIQADVNRFGLEFTIELYATLYNLGYHYLIEDGPGSVSEINKFLKEQQNLYTDTTNYSSFYNRIKQIGLVNDIQYYGIEQSYFGLGLYVLNNWDEFAHYVGDNLLYRLAPTYSKYNTFSPADNMQCINNIYKRIGKSIKNETLNTFVRHYEDGKVIHAYNYYFDVKLTDKEYKFRKKTALNFLFKNYLSTEKRLISMPRNFIFKKLKSFELDNWTQKLRNQNQAAILLILYPKYEKLSEKEIESLNISKDIWDEYKNTGSNVYYVNPTKNIDYLILLDN